MKQMTSAENPVSNRGISIGTDSATT
jgi:hypothetical protein